MPVQVRVATEGRLARCTASTSRPDLITVLGDGQLDLLANDLELGDDPGCGQAQEFTVTFDQAAQVGTAVDLTCEDTYGQATTRTLSAGVD